MPRLYRPETWIRRHPNTGEVERARLTPLPMGDGRTCAWQIVPPLTEGDGPRNYESKAPAKRWMTRHGFLLEAVGEEPQRPQLDLDAPVTHPGQRALDLERAPPLAPDGVPPILKLTQAAALADVGEDVLREAIKRGELPGRRVPGPNGYRVTARALFAWMESQQVAPELLRPKAEIGLPVVEAVIASLHEGAQVRVVEGRLELQHDGAPERWFALGSIVKADLAAAEERCSGGVTHG